MLCFHPQLYILDFYNILFFIHYNVIIILGVEMEYVNQTELSSTAAGALKGFLPLFYLVPPAQSTFKTVAEVPNYVNQVYYTTKSWVKASIM